ncbi:family 78 glycoside hydrolase catalytic domain [Ruthenibacterium lactatiformans]|jgi:alpha-L-rhamnosidase|uniref:family 78 glycoside hydrolase catalytic domain n=1 Tax=Ruthenibacterium lactatiformans TaxID=1550024 RepID=UPI000E73D652|nr:family 78 glycoside hydrolase catalytic domain [Ruthenibacterium lactatiformans]RJW28134.1 alfa-L-rhamnosidase [Subdoligranulum sp. TF05-17AC]
MRAVHLQTEYLTEPLGLGITNPRFYWNCDGGVTQTAYQIVAKRNEQILWDSGKVLSPRMSHISYEGIPLHSRDRVEWSVTLWDENDQPGETAKSWFELGLLDSSDWTAQWITGNYNPRKNIRYPVDCFQKKFRVEKSIDRARLYITACGLYEVHLNGQRVGDFVLAPGCTDYRKRIQYQTYDITQLLGTSNVLEISLADGWYRGSIGCFGPTNVYGRKTKLLCQLELIYSDGRRETVSSNKDWDWSNDGPIRFADLKDGEIYEAGRSPSYAGKAAVCKETVVPTASNNVMVKRRERFPAKLIVTPKGENVLDFGQNLAGFLSFSIQGQKGQRVRLLFGEKLDEQGEFTQKNIHKHHKPVKEFGKLTELLLMFGMENKIRGELQPTPKQEIQFICSGEKDRYQMSFSVFGFRYVKVETEVPFCAEDFEAIAVYSALEETGDFICSNPLVNQLVRNTRWSMKSNFLDIPTDCPTRERLGWLGEGQTFFLTANHLMAAAPFYRKWLADIMDAQKKSGKASAVVPYVGFEMLYGSNGSSVGWADAMVLIPYRYWKLYGDVEILKECYEMMRRYAEFMIAHTGQKNKKAAERNPFNKYTYEKGFHLGEWLEPEDVQDKIVGGKMPLQTEVCTAYLHYTMTCMMKIAHVLGKTEDEKRYRSYADGAKKAYDWLYLQNETIDTDRQAKLVRPLAFGLLDGNKKENVQKRLVQAVERRQYRIGTGFLSTPFVLPVLTEMGRPDLAYKMLENEETPGWLYEVKQGATTMWEDWEGSEFASLNHYAQGAVCQWLFEGVAGIRVDGENHFTITPHPGGTLTYAKGSYRSLYGNVESSWQRTAEGVKLTVTIPANTTADVKLPTGRMQSVCAGTHTYFF